MKMVTVSQAKSRLSEYIKSAERGEEVVIMRGSRPAVLLRPVTEHDLNLSPELSLSALAAFEEEIAGDRRSGALQKVGDDPAGAVTTLKTWQRKHE